MSTKTVEPRSSGTNPSGTRLMRPPTVGIREIRAVNSARTSAPSMPISVNWIHVATPMIALMVTCPRKNPFQTRVISRPSNWNSRR